MNAVGSGWSVPDTDTPNPARMYDYLLGGAANFAADRRAAEQMLAHNPHGRQQTQANRAFLRRVVRFLADQGVRQFLDLGSGVPTVGNVHEIAHQSAPDARVVYVDVEPVAVSYSRHLLGGVPGATVLQVDLADVAEVVRQAGSLLDFSQPVAVLAFAVLHFTTADAAARDLLGAYRDSTAAGSWLGISHVTADDSPAVGEAARGFEHSTLRMRTRAQVAELFAGYELVPPGVVPVPEWHPDDPPDVGPDAFPAAFLGGVGRK